MKIIAVSGGSRNGTNDAMAREALMGAKEEGAEIEFINLYDLELKPCTGCIACVGSLMSGGSGECLLKHDYSRLLQKLREDDGVIFVIPVFEKGAPAIFKILQDRMFGPSNDTGTNTVAKMIAERIGKPGPDPRKFAPKAVSFIGIGGSDWNTRFSCDLNLAVMVQMWTVIDDVVFSWSKSLILDDEGVQKCHDIGTNIAKAAADIENAKYLGDPGVCGNCHSRNFYLHQDGQAECEVCGIKGKLSGEEGFVFTYDQEQLKHAHNLLPGKLKHMKDIGEMESRFAEEKKSDEFKARQEKYKAFLEPTKPTKPTKPTRPGA
jgi:multimeric flavodoxin WrbA